MTLVSQMMYVFFTIKDNQGNDLEGLARIIREKYGENFITQGLINGGPEYEWLSDRIKELECIVERDGKYYFDLNIKPYSKDMIFNAYITGKIKELDKGPSS